MIQVANLTKSFGEQTVLRRCQLEVAAGEKVLILGPSGSGKSTLLHLLAGLDRPDAGTIRVGERDLFAIKEGEAARFRLRNIGFVFQFYHLLPELTVLENVALPALMAGFASAEALSMAMRSLEQVALQGKFDRFPPLLSGGEQQRTAIARAAVLHPAMIFADEPTGNLDAAMGNEVLEYLFRQLEAGQETGKKGTFMMVTHNEGLTPRFDTVYRLESGELKRQ